MPEGEGMRLIDQDPSPGPQRLVPPTHSLTPLLQEELATDIMLLHNLLRESARHPGLLLSVLINLKRIHI